VTIPELAFPGRMTRLPVEILQNKSASRGAFFTLDENHVVISLDFTLMAKEVVEAVVHIQSTQNRFMGKL
jgi:hypothetical protein